MTDSWLLQRLVVIISRIGVTPDDDAGMRLEKAILVSTALMVSVAAFIWGLVYLFFGEPIAAAFPLFYAFFSLTYIIVLGATYRYRFFRFAQHVLTLLLPFLLMLALGGYVNGSAVIVWAFLGPVAALLGGQSRQARYLFIAYLALLILSALLQPLLRTENNLPDPVIIAFFVVNLATLSAIALGVILYFVRQQDLAMQLMQKNRELEQAYLQQEIMLRQSEKLATLGRLSAGMAHELNNPASAAQRGAEQLRDAVPQLREAQFELGSLRFSESQLETLETLDRATAERARQPAATAPLAQADLESEVESWLEGQGVHDAWEVAPMLASMGYEPGSLAALGQSFTAEQFPQVLASVASLYGTYTLLEQIGQGAGRIAGIVKALRSYTYLDQAPRQSVDIHEGLDDTLVMLGNKLGEGVVVCREYAADLPRIEAFGSELNQVWTNIIDNALDAMEGQGDLVLRTCREGSWVVVEIQDSGAGITKGILPKIFDPFFTTKPPGEGLGLGLNISHNIVVQKHKGEIAVRSEPGNTCFAVKLPLNFEAVQEHDADGESEE